MMQWGGHMNTQAWVMGLYLANGPLCDPFTAVQLWCILRWHMKPLRAAADWHTATEDAALENQEGPLLNSMPPVMDGSRWICLTPSKETWQVLHVKNPHLFRATLSSLFYVFFLCFKGHVESSGWRSGGQGIHSLTLTAPAFLIGGRRGE